MKTPLSKQADFSAKSPFQAAAGVEGAVPLLGLSRAANGGSKEPDIKGPIRIAHTLWSGVKGVWGPCSVPVPQLAI